MKSVSQKDKQKHKLWALLCATEHVLFLKTLWDVSIYPNRLLLSLSLIF